MYDSLHFLNDFVNKCYMDFNEYVKSPLCLKRIVLIMYGYTFFSVTSPTLGFIISLFFYLMGKRWYFTII